MDAKPVSRVSRVSRVGLIGHPVAHSRSPAMQQAAFDALGIAARYALWDTPLAELPGRVASLRAPDALGANVTLPHKVAVMPLLDHLAPEAERVADAVNTIVREQVRGGNMRLVGHNTDVAGLETTLRELDAWPMGRRVMVVGTGGTARAVAGVVVRARAAALVVAARRPEAAAEMLASAEQRLGLTLPRAGVLDLAGTESLGAALAACDLLVHATPVGMHDASACALSPALLERMPAGGAVLDVVYAPHETALLRAARAARLAACDGLPLLLHQGAAAFTLWTGRDAPLDAMRAALGLGAALE